MNAVRPPTFRTRTARWPLWAVELKRFAPIMISALFMAATLSSSDRSRAGAAAS